MRAKPEDWWRVRRVGDGVTHIDEPHIRDCYRCNVWHVRGRDSDMLVDSGMGVVSLRDRVPLVTERPLLAVASHTHFDHVAILAGCGVQAGVTRRTDALAGVAEDRDPRSRAREGLQKFPRAVVGMIVDDEEFPVRIRLLLDAGDGGSHKLDPVPHGENDGHQWEFGDGSMEDFPFPFLFRVGVPVLAIAWCPQMPFSA